MVRGLNWSTCFSPQFSLSDWHIVGPSFPYSDISGSLWKKNEPTGLTQLQFPLQLLSSGRKGLIFRNNPEFWKSYKLFHFISQENSSTLCSFINMAQKQRGIRPVQKTSDSALTHQMVPFSRSQLKCLLFSDIKGWLHCNIAVLQWSRSISDHEASWLGRERARERKTKSNSETTCVDWHSLLLLLLLLLSS